MRCSEFSMALYCSPTAVGYLDFWNGFLFSKQTLTTISHIRDINNVTFTRKGQTIPSSIHSSYTSFSVRCSYWWWRQEELYIFRAFQCNCNLKVFHAGLGNCNPMNFLVRGLSADITHKLEVRGPTLHSSPPPASDQPPGLPWDQRIEL